MSSFLEESRRSPEKLRSRGQKNSADRDVLHPASTSTAGTPAREELGMVAGRGRRRSWWWK
jgi:hypothetical protein